MDYYDSELTVYHLMRDLFAALSITCFLYALHRIADGLMIQGRVVAYDALEDAYAPEEREVLIHKIKRSSLHY
jgi:hypothetical protein